MPRAIVILAGVFAVAVGGLAFWVGYGIGQNWHQPINVIIHQPADKP
jgi:hypothetical protein